MITRKHLQTCQRLGERHDVRLHAVRLVRPQAPRPTQAALHLVEHQQRARRVAGCPQPLKELPVEGDANDTSASKEIGSPGGACGLIVSALPQASRSP